MPPGGGGPADAEGAQGVALDAVRRLLAEHQAELLNSMEQLLNRRECEVSTCTTVNVRAPSAAPAAPAAAKKDDRRGGESSFSESQAWPPRSHAGAGQSKLASVLPSRMGMPSVSSGAALPMPPIQEADAPNKAITTASTVLVPPATKPSLANRMSLAATPIGSAEAQQLRALNLTGHLIDRPEAGEKKVLTANRIDRPEAEEKKAASGPSRASANQGRSTTRSDVDRLSRLSRSKELMEKITSTKRNTIPSVHKTSFVGTGSFDSKKAPHFIQFMEEAEQAEEKNNKTSMSSEELALMRSRRSSRHAQPTNCVQRMVQSNYFELFFSVVIISNSFFVGLQVEYGVSHRTDETPTAFYIIQYFYTFIFVTELVLRVVSAGPSFFYCSGPSWHWNYLDAFIVSTSIFEVTMDTLYLVSGEEGGLSGVGSASNARIIRILRIARLMRIIRVARILRFIHALRTFIYSIVATLRSLIWALVLLFMILYVFGILFAQTAGDYLIDTKKHDANTQLITKYWGTLPRAMFTLFKAISGGISWDDVVHPIHYLGATWVTVFIVYISFTYFAVLNVVTGIFCQSAIETAQENEDLMVQAQIASKELYIARIQRLFHELDEDGSGGITFGELEAHIHDENVQAVFGSMEIDTTDAWTLFRLLDSDEGSEVDIAEFVNGLMRLKGNAKRADFVELHVIINRVSTAIHGCTDSVAELIEKVEHLGTCLWKADTRDTQSTRDTTISSLPREGDTQSTSFDDPKSEYEEQRMTDFFQAPWDDNMHNSLLAVSQHKPWDLLVNDDEAEPHSFKLLLSDDEDEAPQPFKIVF